MNNEILILKTTGLKNPGQFNAFTGHTRVNFRTKCLTQNYASREKARCRCMERVGKRPRSISRKLLSQSEEGNGITALFT